MRQEMVEIALEATRKVVQKEMDEDTNRNLIQDFISEVNK